MRRLVVAACAMRCQLSAIDDNSHAGSSPRRTTENRHCRRSTHIRAFAVHIFTALGAALALRRADLAVRGTSGRRCSLCLGIALIVDGIDGTIARQLQGRRGAAALVGRRARPGGRFRHLRVRAGLCDRGRRTAAGARSRSRPASSSSSPARSISPTADEDRRQLFPRLPGAVERGGVLSVRAQAARRGSRGR